MLDRKIVLVTGASSGIGRAIALGCARAGADVALTYRDNQDGAEETAATIRELGRRAEVLPTDISVEADVTALREHPRFGVAAQTTQPIERVRHLVSLVRRRFPRSEVRFVDTVCQPTKQPCRGVISSHSIRLWPQPNRWTRPSAAMASVHQPAA